MQNSTAAALQQALDTITTACSVSSATVSSSHAATPSVLDNCLTISVCRESLLRTEQQSVHSDTSQRHTTPWNPFHANSKRRPLFVCCSLNAESSDMYCSPQTGVVQRIIAPAASNVVEECREDEKRGVASSSLASNGSIAFGTATTNSVLWGLRADKITGLQRRMNTILRSYVEVYYVDTGCTSDSEGRQAAGSAFVRPSEASTRRTGDASIDSNVCVLDVDIIIVSKSRQRKSKRSSLFDLGWEDELPQPLAEEEGDYASSQVVCHHRLEVHLRMDTDQLRLIHAFEMRLHRGMEPWNTASVMDGAVAASTANMETSFDWVLREQRRLYDASWYLNRSLVNTAVQTTSDVGQDACISMDVDRVTCLILSAVQETEGHALQHVLDGAIPALARNSVSLCDSKEGLSAIAEDDQTSSQSVTPTGANHTDDETYRILHASRAELATIALAKKKRVDGSHVMSS